MTNANLHVPFDCLTRHGQCLKPHNPCINIVVPNLTNYECIGVYVGYVCTYGKRGCIGNIGDYKRTGFLWVLFAHLPPAKLSVCQHSVC